MLEKGYEVKLLVRRLEGCKVGIGDACGESGYAGVFFVELKWESAEGSELGKKRRRARIKSTRDATLGADGVVLWDGEFWYECGEEALQESKIDFKVLSCGMMRGAKRRLKIGTTSLDLSQWASPEDGKEINLSLPLIQTRNICGSGLLLCITLTFLKIRNTQQSSYTAHELSVSALSPPQSTASSDNELPKIKSGEKKIVLYTRRRRKHIFHENGGSDSRGSARSMGSSLFIHHNQLNSNDACISNNSAPKVSLSEIAKGFIPSSAKRKRSGRVAKNKREHLMKVIGIEDSVNYVESSCQQLIDSEPLQLSGNSFSCNSVLGSAEDCFFTPRWQQINVVSRDALMELQTEALFASIDQRSEQAGGSSACSALVVVIADWLHFSKGGLPDQCQFDTLIKVGSLEWRELQKNGRLMQLYADGHFDIKTVLHLRPICVDGAKTTIGFFQPEGLPEEVLGFLPGTSSFDDQWKEISEAREKVSGNDSLIYIVGWNDHFFLLKADSEAYYIIDTLGERLFEGCDQGYILKFDKGTKICKTHPQGISEKDETEILYSGYECCKHYFQSFLAALPLKDAIEDNKKGMLTLDSLYGKLQIEFSYTRSAR